MDVTRRKLPVLSDGPLAGQVVCTGGLENVDPRSGKVCAYMVTPHTPAEVVSNVPDLIATPLISLRVGALATPSHCTLVKLLHTYAGQCEPAILVCQIV